MEGAMKCEGPGASTGDNSEWRGTGCSAGSAQLEEAAEPHMHAKTSKPAHGTICEPAQHPLLLSSTAPSHPAGSQARLVTESSTGRGLL